MSRGNARFLSLGVLLSAFLLGGLILPGLVEPASAASYTYNPADVLNGSWDTNANWSPSGRPCAPYEIFNDF